MRRKGYLISAGLALVCSAISFGGCSSIALLDPKGPIGDAERFVILVAIGLMLLVVIPVFIMHFLFSWRYRASNTKATYRPKWSYSGKIDLVVWLGPVAIVILLAILTWSKTHQLDPYKPIRPGDPVNIEVVSLDWKYLFIYPDHNIASVNQLVFPVNVPLSFKLTSDTVMTSFFIPRLGSQVYAMAGRQSRLHLLADQPGTYTGHNQAFSGSGYADMHFEARAASPEEFRAWLQKAGQSSEKLDPARYEKLAAPSEGYPVTYFSSVKPGLFDDIMRKYNPGWGKDPGPPGEKNISGHEKAGSVEEH